MCLCVPFIRRALQFFSKSFLFLFLVEKDFRECRNLSVKFPYVYLCLSSRDLFIFWVRFSPFNSYFCVIPTTVLTVSTWLHAISPLTRFKTREHWVGLCNSIMRKKTSQDLHALIITNLFSCSSIHVLFTVTALFDSITWQEMNTPRNMMTQGLCIPFILISRCPPGQCQLASMASYSHCVNTENSIIKPYMESLQ